MLRTSSQANAPGKAKKRPAPPVMPWGVRKSLLTAANEVNLKSREVLFHAGDAGDGCYFLRDGVVKAAVIAKDGQERLLAVLGPGSLIGELSLFDDQPRSATISALKPCRLLHISKGSFFRLADANPQVYRDHITWAADYLPAGTYAQRGMFVCGGPNGDNGLSGLTRPQPFGINLDGAVAFYYFCLIVTVIALWMISRRPFPSR